MIRVIDLARRFCCFLCHIKDRIYVHMSFSGEKYFEKYCKKKVIDILFWMSIIEDFHCNNDNWPIKIDGIITYEDRKKILILIFYLLDIFFSLFIHTIHMYKVCWSLIVNCICFYSVHNDDETKQKRKIYIIFYKNRYITTVRKKR